MQHQETDQTTTLIQHFANLSNLPKEILFTIFESLSLEELKTFTKLNKYFNKAIEEYFQRCLPGYYRDKKDKEKKDHQKINWLFELKLISEEHELLRTRCKQDDLYYFNLLRTGSLEQIEKYLDKIFNDQNETLATLLSEDSQSGIAKLLQFVSKRAWRLPQCVNDLIFSKVARFLQEQREKTLITEEEKVVAEWYFSAVLQQQNYALSHHGSTINDSLENLMHTSLWEICIQHCRIDLLDIIFTDHTDPLNIPGLCSSLPRALELACDTQQLSMINYVLLQIEQKSNVILDHSWFYINLYLIQLHLITPKLLTNADPYYKHSLCNVAFDLEVSTDVIQLLIPHRDNIDVSLQHNLLVKALKHPEKYRDVVITMLEHGYSLPDEITTVPNIKYYLEKMEPNSIVRHRFVVSALYLTIKKLKNESALFLIDCSSDKPHSFFIELFQYAVQNANEKVALYLIEKKTKEILMTPCYGGNAFTRYELERTALMIACNCNHPRVKVVQSLLDKGAPINAADQSGKNALYFAAENGSNTPVVQLLLKKGAVLLPYNKKITEYYDHPIKQLMQVQQYLIIRDKKKDYGLVRTTAIKLFGEKAKGKAFTKLEKLSAARFYSDFLIAEDKDQFCREHAKELETMVKVLGQGSLRHIPSAQDLEFMRSKISNRNDAVIISDEKVSAP